MKCIICNGDLKEKIVEHKEVGVLLGKYKGLVCSKCNEVFYDAETAAKIQAKSKELGLFGLAKKAKVAEVGNSLAVRIPKRIADFLGLKKESEIKIVPKSHHEVSIEVI